MAFLLAAAAAAPPRAVEHALREAALLEAQVPHVTELRSLTPEAAPATKRKAKRSPPSSTTTAAIGSTCWKRRPDSRHVVGAKYCHNRLLYSTSPACAVACSRHNLEVET